jgi:HK97 family phage portal protein
MSIITAIKTFFRGSPTMGGSIASPLFGSANWTARDYANFAKEAYLINYVSFRCVDMIAQSISSVPWLVYRRSGDEILEVETHKLSKLLRRANPGQGFSAYQYAVTSFLALDGNSFVEKLSPSTGPNRGLPAELHVHRPDLIKPVISSDEILLGYALTKSGRIIKQWEIDPISGRCDLLHLKKFHPLDDIHGLSPVEPASRSIDTSNEALAWNKKLLENDTRPGMLLTYDGALGDDQYQRLREQLDRKYSGARNAGKNLILEGKLKDAKPYGYNPQEMDWNESNWNLARQICLVWGVPTQLLGIPGESTYANFEMAQLDFWETTVNFYLRLLRDEYNNWFFSSEDPHFIDCDLDEIPALAPRRKEKWESVQKADFLTINEKREAVGYEAIDGGDVILTPSTMVPLDDALTEEEVDDSEQEVEDEIVDEELQQLLLETKDAFN